MQSLVGIALLLCCGAGAHPISLAYEPEALQNQRLDISARFLGGIIGGMKEMGNVIQDGVKETQKAVANGANEAVQAGKFVIGHGIHKVGSAGKAVGDGISRVGIMGQALGQNIGGFRQAKSGKIFDKKTVSEVRLGSMGQATKIIGTITQA